MSDRYLKSIRGWWRQLLKWLLSMRRQEPKPGKKVAVIAERPSQGSGLIKKVAEAAEVKPAPQNPPRRARFFDTHVFLNMPKFQPCEKCRAKSKRQEKTTGGAYYRCRTHAEFFVGAGL